MSWLESTCVILERGRFVPTTVAVMTLIQESSSAACTRPEAAIFRSRAFGHMRPLMSLITSSVLVMSVVVMGAQSAHAAAATPADLTMSTQCNVWTNNSPQTSTITVTGAVGDTFTAVEGAGGSGCTAQTFAITGAAGIVSPSTGNVGSSGSPTTFTIGGAGTFTVVALIDSLTIVVVLASSASTTSSGLPDVFQGFPVGSTSSCASVTRPDLDWGGVASGNWTQSWAMWPNGGTGGPVCNRVLWYDTNASRWSSATR